ncbi:hypothetical protein BCA37_17795 [Mycobacterium sp. djl-10]|nr:hypothetical protein BCA37_17795 [Mycobacterium sp. djl-10]
MSRLMKNSEMSERTRQKLVDAALSLFSQHSYYNTSVGDIASAAQMTKGAFYHHFESKEKILLAVHRQSLDALIDDCAGAAAKNLSATDELAELIRIQVRAISESASISDREFFTIGRTSENESSGEWQEIRERRTRIEKFFTEVIERGVAAGDFSPQGDVRLTAYAILGMCYWTQVWYSPKGRRSVEFISDQFVSLALVGLRA